jgi:hypothetical protein
MGSSKWNLSGLILALMEESPPLYLNAFNNILTASTGWADTELLNTFNLCHPLK